MSICIDVWKHICRHCLLQIDDTVTHMKKCEEYNCETGEWKWRCGLILDMLVNEEICE